MDYQLARLIREDAATFLEQTEAIERAICLGVPLYEIEEYLDWMDATAEPPNGKRASKVESGDA